MSNPIASVFTSFYEDIVYSGLRDDYSPAKRKKTIRFNQFILLILFAHFVCVVSYFCFGLYISALINLSAAYFFIVAYHLNLRRQFQLARLLSVLNLNAYLAVMNYMEGLKAGEYLFFFPYFLIMTFIISFTRSIRELIFAYLMTVCCLAFCYYQCPQENHYQVHITGMFDRLYDSNLVLSLLLTTFFSIAIVRINRNNEEAILKEKQFVDTIYNTSLDGVIILDAEALIINDCNNRAVQLLEIEDKRQIVGAPMDSLFTKEHIRLFRNIEMKPEGDSTNRWQGELALTSKKDNTVFAFVNVVSFFDNNRHFWKISILDISEIKMTQFELMKAKQKAETASKAKSRFLSNMSHELRTPLNGIIGASNLLMQEQYLPEQVSHLEILKFSSEHMMVLINEILDFNKIESGRFELENVPVNMRAFLRKLETQFSVQAHTKGLLFLVDVDENLETEFLTDETRLNQVLSNLLSNAIKFTHTGGITLGARKISSTSKKSMIQFMVQDTGIGIPAHKQQEVFDSFTQADTDTTRKYGGTGLGLAISKKLVSLFSGELQLRSEEAKGSTFYFTIELEINENAKMYINDEKVKHLPVFDHLRVLIAEDNIVNMRVARKFLTKWGIEVHEAVNGLEAVEKFRRGTFDLVLIDLEMPEMDGITALAEIRKVHPSIPAIAFTAAVYEDMRIDLMKKGFMEVVPKPFRPEDLHNKIQKLILSRA
ncbi:ATP-binding protein [Puia sp.]|uniref:ATP-binding protein n=1 Tax=Puia sp. TaxID=2045100 RepID=UPI002F3FE5F4